MKEITWDELQRVIDINQKEVEPAKKTEKMRSFKWCGKLDVCCDKAKKEGLILRNRMNTCVEYFQKYK